MNHSTAPPNKRKGIAIGGQEIADGGHRLIDDGCVSNELISTV